MQTGSIIRNLLFVLLLFLSSLGYAQLSKKHYIPPLTSGPNNANPEDQYIYISTPTASLVPYTISAVGGGTITGSVSNTTPQVENIGFGYDTQLFQDFDDSSVVTNNKGYIIEAEAPIYVSVRMNAGGAQAGALVSKGLSALDTTFRIGTFTSSNPTGNYLSFLSVMATEDNTSVTFDDIPAGLTIENYPTGTFPYSRILNEGESYIICIKGDRNTSAMDGLIGALVTSDKPIVVNCGSANGSFGTGGGRDYGIDQIAGLDKVGNEYIFVRGDGTNDWENVLVVAHTDNTSVNINGNAVPAATLNAGDYYVIEGNNYGPNSNMYVETSEDVFMYQGVGSTGEANQGMFFVPPLSCETRGNIDNIASIDRIGSLNYVGGVTIVTKVGATVTVNNQALSSFATVGPSAVTGNSDYETYRITGLTGDVSVQGNDELYVAYFNVNGAATSGSFYSGFQSRPEFNFDVQFATLGNCIGNNLTLSVANAQNFESFEWQFDDGSGNVVLPITDPFITPTVPGKYKLVGELPCNGGFLESVEVPISICPDDIDNDGIIDNLDIDNDNDGITNCTESRGDVTVNLNNLNNPVLEFQDSSTNSTITSGFYGASSSSGGTNTFVGDNLGNFTSTVEAAANGEGSYSMVFTEPINIKLSEDTGYTHVSVDGEYFVVKISPANKNITLVDPDDRLLVDSNFDGLFEAGVTQISGSEIHFKHNPASTGTTPFEFSANQVDGFEFNHRLSNLTDTSNFQSNISLTCFKKDNDNDGVKDELDLDSDNDGIPDFIENQGALVALSGIDTDNNGLDDVYDITVSPIDTDADGVSDFYDLDSDNDGIYDINEADPLFTFLSDTGTIGIDDGPVFGVNGWTDRAETAPDSNIIGYTPDDTDGDGVFSYIDLDSDGDGCNDVIEADFTDLNDNGMLGNTPTTTDVDIYGKVTGAGATDGYTALPNNNFITGAPIIITTHPADTESCELSTTVISVVSSTYDTVQWEVSTDGGLNWNTIIDDATYSGSQTADLTISNTPLSFDTYEYRAFLELAGNSCGLYSDLGELTVILLPVANTAPNMLQCDDDNNGTMPFDLDSQNSSITTVAGMTITYHESQADADADINPITSPFESGNTTIYARVENDANTTCYDTSSFDLEVYDSPFPLLTVTPLQECDDNSVGSDTDGLKTFDLTQKETEILNGQSATDFTLTYFTDAGHTNLIDVPTSFPNTVPNVQTIYVRMTNNTYNTCIADTSFNVEVFTLPVVSNPNTYMQCDDASNDGQAFFNLTLDIIKEEINPNYIAEGLTFTYYFNQGDAQNAVNPIPNPDNYQDALGFTPEIVWVRAENPNGCFREVPITLVVNPSSGALSVYNPTPLFQCDDGLDLRDGVATFDFTHIRDHISNTIFSTFNVTVHFYESLMDAELETNEIPDIANHQNTSSPNIQSIWVRVKSDLGNNCLGLEELTNLLIVEALPFANPVTFSRQCDYDTSDPILSFPFDTSNLEADILNGQDPMNVNITYFNNTGAPLLYSDGTPVVSPIQSVFLTENQTITVRVTNNTTNDFDGPCYDETNIEFIIDEQPVIANTVPLQEFCDDGLDITDENDGLHNFDLSSFENTIRGSQTNMDIYFTYIDEDGATVTNEAANFPNTLISSIQTISVEVINPINTTCTASTTIDLIVHPIPEFTLEEEIIVCGNPFVPEDIIPIQTNSSETFIYEWVFEDGNIVGNTLVLPNSNITQPGKYTLTLTNPITLCPKSLTVDVKAADPPNITPNDLEIVELSENNSVTIINPSSLGNSTYMFSLVSDDGQIYFPYQDSPVFNNLRAGFYTLFAQDVESICDEVELRISVIGHRKFFTPNGDGTNEYWQIQGLDISQANSVIRIYDRYGKLLKQLDPLSVGWDGTFNGSRMPTDDYWFSLVLQDGRTLLGHFTLKR